MVTIHNSRTRSLGISSINTLISQVGVLAYRVSLALAMEKAYTMELV
jgi:hypothetical protein